jgi:hypothetical protein
MAEACGPIFPIQSNSEIQMSNSEFDQRISDVSKRITERVYGAW